MDVSRLTKFDWAAVGAALLTIISLWFPWYGVDLGGGAALAGVDANTSAWEALDGIDILILLLSLAAIALVLLRLAPSIKLPVPTSLALMGVGAVVVLLVVFRIIDKPWGDLGNEYFKVDAGVRWGIFATLVFGAAIAGTGFLKLSEGPAPTLGAAGTAPQYRQQPYAAPQAPAQPQQYAAPAAPAAPPYQAPVAPAAPGAPAASAAPQAGPGGGFCTKCGAALPTADAQFCTSCGAQRGQ